MSGRYQTADQAKQANIDAMGDDLGRLYSALWQSIAMAHVHWKEYVELFGTRPERIDLLNRAAPNFFHMLQEQLWDMSLLHLARLTDPEKSLGRSDKANLTVQALPTYIDDLLLKQEVSNRVTLAVKATNFCRDWRNRKIAHHDLKLALEDEAVPLADASRLDVKLALQNLTSVINAISNHFFQSEVMFDLGIRSSGARSLLYVINDGVRLRDDRKRRFLEGKPTPDDFDFARVEI